MLKTMSTSLVLAILPTVITCSISSDSLHCPNLQLALSLLQRDFAISSITIDNAAATGQVIDLTRFASLQRIQILNTDLTCDDFKLKSGTTLKLKDKLCEYSGTTEADFHTTNSFISGLTKSAVVAFKTPWIYIAPEILTGIVAIFALRITVLLIRRLFRKSNSQIRIEDQGTPSPHPVCAIRRSRRVRKMPQRYGHNIT